MTNPVYGPRDHALARRFERERIGFTGQDVRYYSLNRHRSNVDPLYNEPVVWSYDEFIVNAHIQFEEKDQRDPSAAETGLEVAIDGTLHIAFSEWSERAPDTRRPKEGDVVLTHEVYFDVVKANSGGKMVDMPNFVGYELTLKRRLKFDASRKVDDPYA